MATYTPRGDGLVNVDVGGGRVLPMGEAQAQAGGATLAVMPPQPGAPPPVASPYSALGPEAVAGPGGGPATPMPMAPTPGDAGPGSIMALYGPGSQPSPDQFRAMLGRQAQPAAASHEAPPNQLPAKFDTLPVAQPSAEGLTRIDPRSATPQGPPGINFGATSPGRIVQTSKGGDIRASFVRRPGEELAPGVKEYADSLDPAEIASRHETATTNAAIARDNAVAEQISATKDAEAELEQQRQQVASNRAALQQKLDIVDRREREAADATPQTRREVLQSRGALAGVMSGLSIALGGWVQGLRGGENPGLKIVNDSIESEISSQRAKWEASKDKIGAARSDFGQAMQLYGDPNMAEADMRMRALTLAANMANAYKTQGENQEWMANQQQVSQALAAQAAGEKQKWKTLADGQVVQENYVYKPPTYAQVGGPPKVTKDQREQMKEARERQVRLPDGSYAYAVNPAHVRALQDKITAANNTLDAFSQIRALLPKGGGPVTDPNVRKQIEAIQDRALSSLSASEAQGVVTKADAERASATLSDINAIITDGGAGLKATESVVRNNMEATVRDNTYADPDATTPTRSGKASTFKAGLE
jgi:hypothetical protein